MVQRQGPPGSGKPEKSLFETLFPSIYSLYKMVKKDRPSPKKSAKGREASSQPNRSRPSQGADGQQRRGRPVRAPQVQEQLVQEPEDDSPLIVADSPQSVEPVYEPPPILDLPESPSEPRIAREAPPTVLPDPERISEQPLETDYIQDVAEPTRIPRIDEAPPPQQRPRQQPPPQQEEALATTSPAVTDISGSWVEIEGTTDKAYEELKGAQSLRTQAQSMRTQAEQILDEADTIQQEAENVMVQARESFSKALALNPSALKTMADNVRSLEEAIKTERYLRQGTRQQAEEEADGARQRATEAILNALSAVRKATSYVNRELEEARRTTSSAQSLKESSQNDLQRARAMMGQSASLMRQEAQRLLSNPSIGQVGASEKAGVPPASSPSSPLESWSPMEPESSSEAQESSQPIRDDVPVIPLFSESSTAPGVADTGAPAVQTSGELDKQQEILQVGQAANSPAAQAEEQPIQAPDPQPFVSAAAEPNPAVEGQQEVDRTQGLESALNEFLQSTDQSKRDLDSVLNQFLQSGEEPDAPAEPENPEPLPSAPAAPEVSLIESLDFLDLGVEEPQVGPASGIEGAPAQPVGNAIVSPGNEDPAVTVGGEEFGDDLLAELQESLANLTSIEGAAGTGLDTSVTEVQMPVEPPVASPPPQTAAPLVGFSGILRIVVTPVANSDTLSSFGRVIDSVVGVGKIVNQSLLPDGSGHEFTLDLGENVLTVGQLKSGLPNGEIAALGSDRLHVHLRPVMG